MGSNAKSEWYYAGGASFSVRLEWLEDILAVAETGSFTEAAERRRLTQSAFSRRVQTIEEHVGAELFDRSRKPVQLRPTTADQREQIGRLAAMLRQLVHDLKRGDRRSTNHLVVASQHSLAATLAPVILRALQARREDIHVRLRSANRDECFGLLLSRQAEIALAYRIAGEKHPIEADYIEVLDMGTERLVPVFAKAQEAWLRESLEADELPYIAYPSEVFLGSVLDRAVLPRVGAFCRAVPKVETALTLAALELAAQGLGVSWIPARLAATRIRDGTLIDLSTRLPAPDLDITAVRLAGPRGHADSAVWDLLSLPSITGA